MRSRKVVAILALCLCANLETVVYPEKPKTDTTIQSINGGPVDQFLVCGIDNRIYWTNLDNPETISTLIPIPMIGSQFGRFEISFKSSDVQGDCVVRFIRIRPEKKNAQGVISQKGEVVVGDLFKSKPHDNGLHTYKSRQIELLDGDGLSIEIRPTYRLDQKVADKYFYKTPGHTKIGSIKYSGEFSANRLPDENERPWENRELEKVRPAKPAVTSPVPFFLVPFNQYHNLLKCKKDEVKVQSEEEIEELVVPSEHADLHRALDYALIPDDFQPYPWVINYNPNTHPDYWTSTFPYRYMDGMSGGSDFIPSTLHLRPDTNSNTANPEFEIWYVHYAYNSGTYTQNNVYQGTTIAEREKAIPGILLRKPPSSNSNQYDFYTIVLVTEASGVVFDNDDSTGYGEKYTQWVIPSLMQ